MTTQVNLNVTVSEGASPEVIKGVRERLTASITFHLPALSTFDLMRAQVFVEGLAKTAEATGTARPLTSASLAAEQQARETPKGA